MAHPIARLTPGSTFKRPDEPRGGKPELTTQEIAAAAAQIPDSLAYHAVMAWYCDQHPSGEVWPELMLDLQNCVVRAWNLLKRNRRAPKSIKLETLHGIAAAAWYDFVSTKKTTLRDKAEAAKMSARTFEAYSELHATTVAEINTRLNAGLRFIRAQLKESEGGT